MISLHMFNDQFAHVQCSIHAQCSMISLHALHIIITDDNGTKMCSEERLFSIDHSLALRSIFDRNLGPHKLEWFG